MEQDLRRVEKESMGGGGGHTIDRRVACGGKNIQLSINLSVLLSSLFV